MRSLSFRPAQRGYAVVFFLFFVAAIFLGAYSLYDSGWVASERIRLQNTADNTTYSAVNMLSRDMNMMAITNRGMIANQVMVGQLVGLSSWSNYLEQVTFNIEMIAKLTYVFPPVGIVVNNIAMAVSKVVSQASSVIDKTAATLIGVQDTLNGAISSLQSAYHIATYGMIPEMYLAVLKENDPDASVDALATIHNIDEFLSLMQGEFQQYRTHEPDTGLWGGGLSAKQKHENERIAQFGKLVNDSRDAFTADRSSSYGKIVVPIVPPIRAGIDVRGGTDFVPSEVNGRTQWEWTSIDAMSLNTGVWVPPTPFSSGGWEDTEVPFGWGAAHALNNGQTGNYYNYQANRNRVLTTHQANNNWNNVDYDAWGKNSRYWRDAFRGGSTSTRTAARLAAINDGNNNVRKISGIRPFYDFRSNDPRNATDTLTLIFSKPADSLRLRRNLEEDYSDGYVSDALNVDEKGSVPGNRLYALASARVTFERPNDLPLAGSATPWAVSWGRHDGLHEYGNLYNPFWEPKLARTDAKLVNLVITAFGG